MSASLVRTYIPFVKTLAYDMQHKLLKRTRACIQIVKSSPVYEYLNNRIVAYALLTVFTLKGTETPIDNQ